MFKKKEYSIKSNQVKKRDGRIVDFDETKINNAIIKALFASGEILEAEVKKKSLEFSAQVVVILENRFDGHTMPTVEQIQDIAEEVLMKNGLFKTARAYIIYREQHRFLRESEKLIKKSTVFVDDYLEEIDWRVNENSNMAYSLQGLNNYIANIITTKYWLEKIYPPPIRRAYEEGDFHIHDLGILAVYCCGWDLKDLLTRGFGGVGGKIQSKPPKHFRTALGQIINFFYTIQGEAAGAMAFANFDTLLAPFIHYDNLTYAEVKQAIQEFLFNMNVPTRVGFQTPFTNITMDLVPPKTLGEEAIIIGGAPQKEQYKDFQQEMNLLNKIFAEVMLEGDAQSRVFTFPIPTYNITKNFDWDNPYWEPIWEMSAKYGIPYFSNFINSDMSPEDARSMCCRLRLDNRELYKRGGGLFGAYPLTGSTGVVTLNLPRLGYLAKNKADLFERLEKMMGLAKTSLEIKRKTLERFTEQGLYPYCRYYLGNIKKQRGQYWGNHFSTIGIIGMNELLVNFIGKNIAEEEGKSLALEILDFMREKIISFQKETDNLYNLEATPAEGTSYRLAKLDKERYPEIISASELRYEDNPTIPATEKVDLVVEPVNTEAQKQTVCA
ncbi:ribonucleoside triphosphate reductase [Patescibacteria group bacterium]|nr:ribonucleoside triphosphate reductase [Patescibacteria group bacterium]MBU3999724.1 ribonucleoside triphosphate reductase [Patescibacteria group bacterium]MBU4057119.1 ribonucleoside triphosphate reductase [Patescibacteria group bacterium]MBU4369013.1 ribonucleoside triphosphate reductase [Patescibacteria group bacterium]